MVLTDVSPAMRIDAYTHNVKVSKFTQAGKHALLEYCRGLAQFGYVRVGRHVERQMLRVYVGVTRDRSEFRFHRNQLEDLLRHLGKWGFASNMIQIVEHPLYEPVGVDFPLKDTRPPRKEQVPIIDYLVEPPKEGYAPSKAVTLQTGKGKAQPLDAKIKVPGGWKTMGEMSVGQPVIAADGSVTEVTGVYPQGEKQIYRITFADGRSTECCAEHLWKVFYVNTVPHQRWKVVNTVEMLRLISMPNPRVYVQLAQPEEASSIDLPVDPYLMGILLGDGCLRQGRVAIVTADKFIVDEVERLLPPGHKLAYTSKYDYVVRGDTKLREALQDLEIYGHESFRKFIPEKYFKGSIEQRIALLQGLLDADGTVQKSGSVSFCSTSLELAMGVQYLVRSLGGIAALRPRQTHYTHKGEKRAGRKAYEVDIRYKRPSQLFRLPRKLERVSDSNQYADELKLRVVSVEPVSLKKAQCISVAHPDHLYVTDEFIVTHNTFLSLNAIHQIGQRTVLVVKGMYVEKWIKDVEEAFHCKPGDVMVVRGAKHLRALLQLGLEKKLEAKFIIISLTTMRNYLDEYEQYHNSELFPYPIRPDQFYETLGAGIRLIDEVHQDFHAVYRFDLYSNVPKSISLSATLDSDDRFINHMYETIWPLGTRAPEIAYHKYIVMKCLWYSLNAPRKIRCQNFMKQYSHVMFEQSLMKDQQVLRNYLDMITGIVTESYIRVRQEGQKMLIFCSTIEMCTILRNHLARLMPSLTINRYVGEDEYDALLNADICVSTLLSAGTAVDIPNLRITLMTTALSSKQANIQMLGRTRPLKDWPDVTPECLFLAAREIEKHVKYAKEKSEKLDGKVLSYKEMQTPFRV